MNHKHFRGSALPWSDPVVPVVRPRGPHPWQEVRVGALFTTVPDTDEPRLDQREYLACLGPMNDFYHACEHLRVIRNLIVAPDDPAGAVWLERHGHLLKNGRWKSVMAAIALRKPRRGCATQLHTELAYFHKNRHRMHYLRYRRRGLSIGSGGVESACKQVVTRRIKVSGARWNPLSCQHMLHLRCAYLTNPPALQQAA